MRRHRPSGGIQMFSFLDAMVCTMGALLVLVHAFARHGEVEATQKSLSAAAAEDTEPSEDRGSLAWRIAQLKESREKTEAQLADARLQLSHVEDHQRRLVEKFNQLKIAAIELDRAGNSKSKEREQALADLAAAQEMVNEAREALKQARRDAQQNATAYSVVPYEGPNMTHRRPIYIECRPGAIILQPEGIELTPEDFSGFLGPGNPLASALRGIREYWARQSPPTPGKPADEPYPLMLVRPEGVEAYYAARSALDSWGSDFGYELVGSDWDLKYPEPDPQLAELTRSVVADARMRMRELVIATREMQRERAPRAALHASSRGGFVPERGPRGGGGRSGFPGRGGGGWDSLGTNWARGSGGSGTGSDATGAGNGGTAGTGMPGGSLNGTANSDALGSGSGYGPQEAYSGLGTNQNGSSSAAGGGGQGAGRSDRYASRDSSSTGTRAEGADGSSGGKMSEGQSSDGSAGSPNGTSRYGQSSGNSNAKGNNSKSDPSSVAGSPSGTVRSGNPAGNSGSPGGRESSSGSGTQGSSSSSSSGQSSGASATMGGPAFGAQQSSKPASMAKSRGRDWGLPDAGMGAAATRPILIECHNDRLIILPETRSELPKEVQLGPQAQASMDEFVGNVWQHMKGWGTAGKGLYWRPTLVMDVKPGAADRYAEVKALLADSGMDVHERPPQTPARSQQTIVKQPKKTTRK